MNRGSTFNPSANDILSSSRLKDKDSLATLEEKRLFKQTVGQLGWVTSISRPEGSFAFCLLSTKQSNPTMRDFTRLKKEVRELKTIDSWMKIGKLDFSNLHVAVYCDASFGSLEGGASQVGFIVFLQDQNSRSVPITWASRKAKRVARSSLTAETLAAVEAIDFAMVVQQATEELIKKKLPPIKLYTDNKSLHDATKTTNTLADKRLLIDMAALREMIEEKQVEVIWISSKEQLADVLTKPGVCKRSLTEVLANGSLKPVTSSSHSQ